MVATLRSSLEPQCLKFCRRGAKEEHVIPRLCAICQEGIDMGINIRAFTCLDNVRIC